MASSTLMTDMAIKEYSHIYIRWCTMMRREDVIIWCIKLTLLVRNDILQINNECLLILIL